MARVTKSLTDTQLKQAKPKDKAYKLNDGNGLYLFVAPSGIKRWRLDYKHPHTGKRDTYTQIGEYPSVSLAEARNQAKQAKELLASGIDPKTHYKSQHEAVTFEVMAAEALAYRKQQNDFRIDKLTKDIKEKELQSQKTKKPYDHHHRNRLKNKIIPEIGTMIYTLITTDIMQKKIINPILERGKNAEAKKTKEAISMVFDYAIKKYKLLKENPAKGLDYGQITKKNYSALTLEHEIEPFLQAAWFYRERYPRANRHTAALLKLQILLFLRPSELRTLTWDSYSHEHKTLEVYISKLKKILPVPLPEQAIAILDDLGQYQSTNNPYIFRTPNTNKNMPLSDNALREVLKKLGYKGKQTPHGLRATARTLIAEELGLDESHIEKQLSHTDKTGLAGAYDRATFFKQRRKILNIWARYVEALANNEDVNKLKADYEPTPAEVLQSLLNKGMTKAELKALIDTP